MAKKKTVKKKVEAPKAKTTVKAEACSGCEILIGLGVVAAVIALIAYACGAFDSDIKAGKCYIDRSYQPVIVAYTYKSLDEVVLRSAQVRESTLFGGWYLDEDYSKPARERTFDFVEENYTEVKCFNRG